MKNKEKSMFLWMLLVMVSSNNLVIPVISITSDNNNNNSYGNEKTFFSPADTHVVSNPSSGNGQSNCITPPSPSGGSGGYDPSPLVPITPPTPSGGGSSGGYNPSPLVPITPPSGGSGGYYPTPSPTPPTKGGSGGSYHRPKHHHPKNPPSGGGCACPSPPPSHGGSGGYYPPTPKTPRNPPSSPLVPSPPPTSGGGGGYYPPSSPLVPSPPPTSGGGGGGYYPPSSPLVPSPPSITDPSSPPTPFDPSSPPFPCTYWGNHPSLIFGVLGWWATADGIFGGTTLPGLTSSTSLHQMLTNPRNDGYGSLYREGTASFLNSMASKDFPFSTNQVKDSFLGSLSSDKVAAAQAKRFKLANEKKFKLIASSKP